MCRNDYAAVRLCAAPQAGATGPASLASTLSHALAETRAGRVRVNVLSPGFSCILASIPFISDLRTGSLSGGAGEAAIASAAAAQPVRVLDLPSTVFAVITDANTVDSQAGYVGSRRRQGRTW